MTLLMLCSLKALTQQDTLIPKKNQRLDFAKTYFELGGGFSPAFKGTRIVNNQKTSVTHSSSFNPYLSWGGFHFWGHAEFYVNFPLSQLDFSSNDQVKAALTHWVTTGARFLPWKYQPGKIRPYVGISWSGLDLKQSVEGEDNPTLSKSFMLVPEAGVLYGYKNFSLRLGLHYFYDNKWVYPISKTSFEKITTPKFRIQAGLAYAFEASRHKSEEVNKKWNSYKTVSKLGEGAQYAGDFFVGIGPSSSFSLTKTTYNQEMLPYLKDQIASEGYFDIALGYQFNKAGVFCALSFRNPTFTNNGYGTTQTIKKTSLAFEVNKFLTDYSGFVPYIGLNVAYDQLGYTEETAQNSKELTFSKIEPGVTIGWDILPGKTDECLILRTNLRWYPLSSFEVEGKKFDFSQLEYNLIQLVFYPGRYLRGKRTKTK
ncbi:hypothetical protein M23134_00661 [Microscilla marina ATCC 23134]|uniref:Uncharacterized protein n=2 Tax=Microscilla marina TaxID=1027 RepID=A1ZVM1_MICM2|nr:hypothetical protein M23134_00661 [Microscilla marina ATCC 23134]